MTAGKLKDSVPTKGKATNKRGAFSTNRHSEWLPLDASGTATEAFESCASAVSQAI